MVGTPSTLVTRAASRTAAALITLATIAMLVPAAVAAAPPELSEFPLAEGVSPFGIAQGSDGAMWFTERATDSVGRIEHDGTLGPWVALETGADPTAIATGVDDAVWFTEQGTNRIGRIATDGSLSEFPVPTDSAAVAGITAGPDGAMWFTERSAHRIGRIATDGTISEFPLPSSLPGPLGITAGPDGAVWFTEHRGNRIGRITTTGDVTTYPVPTAASDPTAIAVGWDGAMWFTGPDTDVIGRVALDGSITEFPLPTVGASPFSIAAGPDDAVWFIEGNASTIGRLGAPATPVDTTPPTIRIDSPADGGVVVPGSGHVADFLCADDGGSGIIACDGTVPDGAPIDTAPGSHRFDVHAADEAGNSASASAWYLAFADADGSIASGSQRAGPWATLELDLGAKAPRNASDVVAAGFPLSRQVDCADPSIDRSAASLADARISTRQTLLVTRWRTERAWAGTCRAITFRFVAPGWTGADATFVMAFR